MELLIIITIVFVVLSIIVAIIICCLFVCKCCTFDSRTSSSYSSHSESRTVTASARDGGRTEYYSNSTDHNLQSSMPLPPLGFERNGYHSSEMIAPSPPKPAPIGFEYSSETPQREINDSTNSIISGRFFSNTQSASPKGPPYPAASDNGRIPYPVQTSSESHLIGSAAPHPTTTRPPYPVSSTSETKTVSFESKSGPHRAASDNIRSPYPVSTSTNSIRSDSYSTPYSTTVNQSYPSLSANEITTYSFEKRVPYPGPPTLRRPVKKYPSQVSLYDNV